MSSTRPSSRRRGLTASGAVGLALLLGAVGAAVDVATGPGLRGVFAVCFVLGCGAAAAAVSREHLPTAVVMPPLVYVVLAVAGGVVERAGNQGSFVTRQALELANSLFLGAPVLLAATALALVVALARVVAGSGGPVGSQALSEMPAARRSRRSSGGRANSSDS